MDADCFLLFSLGSPIERCTSATTGQWSSAEPTPDIDFLSYSRPRVGISREESVECDHVILSEQFTHPFTILVLSDGCMSSKTISSDTSNTCVEVTKQQTQPTTRDGGHALVHLHVESVRVMWCGHFTRCVLDDDVQYPSDSVML